MSWAQAVQKPQQNSGPARPLKHVLSLTTGPNSLVDFASLVRLRVDVPLATTMSAPSAQDSTDEEEAAQQAESLTCAIGQLHQVIQYIEQSSEEARVSAVLELMQDKTLQLLCSKALVAKIYKSLLPHQASGGYTMAPAKSCLSQKPVAAWDLEEALQTAVIKTLTGCSSGTPSLSNMANLQPESAAAAGPGRNSAPSLQRWMCLSRHKLVDTNILAAVPGDVNTTPFAELEVKHDATDKSLLLIIHAAGSIRYRLFSPAHALQQDPKSLKAPLSLAVTDEDLLADPTKLAAAARQLEGRAVKLLPDERLAFIKSLTAAPTDPTQLQHMAQSWLGSYGLQLAPSYPFLLGVASHPEAEAAQLQVPSCCVLTNLGLSVMPGSVAGGSCHQAAVSRLVAELQAAAAGYSFWGHKLSVQLRDNRQAGAGLSQANLQVSTQGSQPTDLIMEAAAAAAPLAKAYSLNTQWTPASDLSKLQLAAKQETGPAAGGSKQQATAGHQHLTATTAQLMGLVDADNACFGTGADSQAGGCSRQHEQGVSSRADKGRWQGLRAFLAERDTERQQQQQHKPPITKGSRPSQAGGATASGSGRLLSAASANSSINTGGETAASATAAGKAGPPAAPRFGSRKPGASKPSAGPAAKAAAGAGRKLGVAGKAAVGAGAGGTAGAKLMAALQAESDAARAATGAAGIAGSTAATQAAGSDAPKPLLGKRPAGPSEIGTEAGGKPPTAKKAKAAATGAVAAQPKAPKKAAAAAASGTMPAAVLSPARAIADPGAAGDTSSQPPAAPGQQQQRKRAKASDLDLSTVRSKVQAAYAASSGSCLKGVSVPEMQCYLRAEGLKGGSAKRAHVEARLLALLAGSAGGPGS